MSSVAFATAAPIVSSPVADRAASEGPEMVPGAASTDELPYARAGLSLGALERPRPGKSLFASSPKATERTAPTS